MAKYSTGGGGSRDSGGSCELCGADSDRLTEAVIAGASLLVCPNCAPHSDEQQSKSSREDESRPADRKREVVRKVARLQDAQRGDTHWAEQGTHYDDDPLPYLSSNYGQTVESARQAAGLRIDELAAELGVSEDELLAVEQGRAARAGIGGSLITALEEKLEIDITD